MRLSSKLALKMKGGWIISISMDFFCHLWWINVRKGKKLKKRFIKKTLQSIKNKIVRNLGENVRMWVNVILFISVTAGEFYFRDARLTLNKAWIYNVGQQWLLHLKHLNRLSYIKTNSKTHQQTKINKLT